jgi:hypothetical protein
MQEVGIAVSSDTPIGVTASPLEQLSPDGHNGSRRAMGMIGFMIGPSGAKLRAGVKERKCRKFLQVNFVPRRRPEG